MSHAWVLPLLLWISSSYAADTERVIKEMLRTSNVSETEIRENHKTGCESGNTYAMRICARYRFVSADIDLNDVYRKLVKKESIPSSKQKLVAAQKAWLQYRDLTCEYESNAWDGGMQGAMISSCKEELTNARVAKLQEYLNCTEPGCA